LPHGEPFSADHHEAAKPQQKRNGHANYREMLGTIEISRSSPKGSRHATAPASRNPQVTPSTTIIIEP
jgi:hypothetical protein